jgi:AraC-like DNA-binding protein
MFTTLSDHEFLKIVVKILTKNGMKHADIKKALECKFKRSFSLISKRFIRCTKETVFTVHDRLIAENAKVMLSEKKSQEVLYDLGFRSESYFATWFRKHTGVTPAGYQRKNI